MSIFQSKTIRSRKIVRQRAAIMILVLWIIIVLSVMAYSLTYEMRLSLKSNSLTQKKVQARALCRMGMAKAVMDLRNDRLIGAADPGRTNDTLADVWALTEDKTEIEPEDMDDCTYTVRIVDEERKFNINFLNPDSRMIVEYLLINVCDVDEEVSKKIVSAMIDYVDANVMSLDELDVDEIEYYTEWGREQFGEQLPADWTFRPKNEGLICIDELLEIPGITHEILFGDPRETIADPIERIDSDEPSYALADYLTVSETSGINLNTCSPQILAAIIYAGMGEGSDPEPFVDEVIKLRENLLEMRTDGGYGLLALKQLEQANLGEAVVNNLKSVTPVTVRSVNFKIFSQGVYRGIHENMEALVRVDVESYAIDPDNEDSFGKRDAKASGMLVDQENVKFDPAVRVIQMQD